MIQSVKEIKSNRYKTVEHKSGVYTWWFNQQCLDTVLNPLVNVDRNRLQFKMIQGEKYFALYYGIAKDCNQRARWHMEQKHTTSSLTYLSTLRQTLSALLGIDMSKSEQEVSKFMEDNCYWEWDYTTSREEAVKLEHVEINNNYYPLNIQGNKIVARETVKSLLDLRKQHKK